MASSKKPEKEKTAKEKKDLESAALVDPIPNVSSTGHTTPLPPAETQVILPIVDASPQATTPVEGYFPGKVHYDEIDVAFALARVTQDGKGEREPDPPDFKGFPAEGVIREG